MMKCRCGGKNNIKEQNVWGRMHDKLQQAKNQTRDKLVQYTSGNDLKINRAAVIGALSAAGSVASFVANNTPNDAVKVATLLSMMACNASMLYYGGYAVAFREKSHLYCDLRSAAKNMGDKISSGYRKIINKHLNKGNPLLNNILKQRQSNIKA